MVKNSIFVNKCPRKCNVRSKIYKLRSYCSQPLNARTKPNFSFPLHVSYWIQHQALGHCKSSSSKPKYSLKPKSLIPDILKICPITPSDSSNLIIKKFQFAAEQLLLQATVRSAIQISTTCADCKPPLPCFACPLNKAA